jgi:hypothetical protein
MKRRRGQFYARWNWMRGATNNPNHNDYPNIGGRGIQSHWGRGQYDLFESWILSKLGPPRGRSKFLTRIDIDDDFRPGNLYWATGEEKGNRPDGHSVQLTYRRRTQCLKSWAREYGINHHTLASRLRLGWALKRALTEDIHR